MRLKSAPPTRRRSVAEGQAYARERYAGGPGRKEQPLHTRAFDLPVGGEGREEQEKARRWMFGTEARVTCGDLTLISSREARYNESDAASEVS